MANEGSRTCSDCQGAMSPIIIMDHSYERLTGRVSPGQLSYHLPEDRQSFWTGKFATAGLVEAFLCKGCGRIALYAGKPDA